MLAYSTLNTQPVRAWFAILHCYLNPTSVMLNSTKLWTTRCTLLELTTLSLKSLSCLSGWTNRLLKFSDPNHIHAGCP
ncbi:protein of unknown function [Nitrospira defluvii]|uniref:Uncharacterized protein n=1 Tax=Nitrospira defluvii TaxID=330214 RepID=D8PA08_9BACT|nr:protein of unknown function [Nitrospira defluvii]